ncbi:MAG: hypothetical protein N2248_07880 [candidate division WOR-3 bacterium]|uniref:DUF3108 domain-containing protein n=1 Tax=candidate division WOR-3 bacterium TaxID=2052148 RepID=A0A7C3EGP0_UNCW3|nr:hypothetical protein [candidate division WOR-3 bacterium]
MPFSGRKTGVMVAVSGLLLLLVGLIAGCSERVLFRAGRNYFPLSAGRSWKYALGNDTVYVEVRGDTAVLNRGCIQVDRNFAPEYYITSPNEVRKLIVTTRPRPGGEDTVEFRFGLLYWLPPVLGNRYQDRFDTTLISGPDTIAFTHLLDIRVGEIETVTVPAGEFEDCYRLEFTETIVSEDTTVINWVEWLAPDVGVVKRSTGAGDELLVEYR